MANELFKIALGGIVLASLAFGAKASGVEQKLKGNFDSLVSSFSGTVPDSQEQEQEAKPENNSNPDNESSTSQTVPIIFDDGKDNDDEIPLVGLPDFIPARVSVSDKKLVGISDSPKSNARKIIPVITANSPTKKVQTGLDTEQVFEGGGEGFVGATIRETPIERLSLNQITQKLGVSASKAASLRAEAQGKDRDFDFGTNTGSGQKGNSKRATRESLEERLARAAARATKTFDSGSITNF